MTAVEAIGASMAGHMVREPAQPIAGAPSPVETRTAVPDQAPINPGKQFFSPIMDYNAEAGKLVVLYRDPKSGEVTDQIPSKRALEKYAEARRQQSREAYEAFLVSQNGASRGEVTSEGGSEAQTNGSDSVAKIGFAAVADSGGADRGSGTEGSAYTVSQGSANFGVPLRVVV